MTFQVEENIPRPFSCQPISGSSVQVFQKAGTVNPALSLSRSGFPIYHVALVMFPGPQRCMKWDWRDWRKQQELWISRAGMDKGRTWRSIISTHCSLSRCLAAGKVAKEDREIARENQSLKAGYCCSIKTTGAGEAKRGGSGINIKKI